MITRRFWPLVGGAETVMANLAGELRLLGCQVQMLTARWEKNWPTEIVHRDVSITRLPQPKARGWGTMLYMRAIYQWLRKHHQDIDAVFVSMLKHDAHIAIRYGQRFGLPVIVRAEGGGDTGDCHWHTIGRFGMRIRERTQLADAWIAPSQAIFDEMIAAGYDANRGSLIPNGVRIPELRTQTLQGDARAALAEAHPILQVPPMKPLLVYTGRFHEGKGLLDLIAAWPIVLQTHPQARLWLIGEGEQGPELWRAIQERELTRRIIMPGSFDDLSDVLYAADAMVLPSYQEGMSMSLLEAMAAGLPVLASDIPGNRTLVTDHKTGRLFPTRSPEALAQTILESLATPTETKRLGENARAIVQECYSVRKMAEQHLAVIETAVARQPTPSPITTGREV